jgi:hypothetical protein
MRGNAAQCFEHTGLLALRYFENINLSQPPKRGDQPNHKDQWLFLKRGRGVGGKASQSRPVKDSGEGKLESRPLW